MYFTVCQVSVPRELVALMSALRDGQEPDPSDSSRVIYRFRQPVSVLSSFSLFPNESICQKCISEKTERHSSFSFLQVPMPSYLIAIVVGALESRWSFCCAFFIYHNECNFSIIEIVLLNVSIGQIRDSSLLSSLI